MRLERVRCSSSWGGQEHGEGLAVGVSVIEDDEGEAELVPNLGGKVILACVGWEDTKQLYCQNIQVSMGV